MWGLATLPDSVQQNGGRIGNKINVATIRATLQFLPPSNPAIVSRVRVCLVLFPEPFAQSATQQPPTALDLPAADSVFNVTAPALGSTTLALYRKNSPTRFKIMRDFTFYLKGGTLPATTGVPTYQSTTRPVIKKLVHTFNRIPVEWFRNPQFSAPGVPVDQMPNKNLFAVAIWCETVQPLNQPPAQGDAPSYKLMHSRITYCDT